MQEKSLESLEFLIPSNAVKCVPPTLLGVYECFKFLKDVAPLDLVDLEWRKQALEETDDTGNVGSDVDFWKKRLSQKVLLGDLKYPNLRKVVSCLMSLPFSNAPVERLFSALKIVKSDCRNTLKRESLVGLLHTQQGMKSYNLPAEKLNVADHP